jgi:folate-binding protein YgfZ
LNGLLTCDVRALASGHGAWGLALTRAGKIQSDIWVLPGSGKHEGSLFVAVSSEQAPKLYQEFDRMLIMEDAELLEHSADYAWISLFGEAAAQLGEVLATEHDGACAALSWTTIRGAALVVPRQALSACEAQLERASVSVLGDVQWDTFRIGHSLPEFGRDYSEADRPHEAALERRAVCWTKGCYLGQEVVCMQDMRGKVKRSLRRLRAETALAPRPGVAVMAAGAAIGKVTSVASENDHWLCFAQVKLESLGADALELDGIPGEVGLVD